MTLSQSKMVKRIRDYVETRDLYHNDPNYEIKEFRVEPLEGTSIISVYCVTGRINDEGTMAAILCRITRHIFIGARGGVSAYRPYKLSGKVTAKRARLTGWSDVVQYGHY